MLFSEQAIRRAAGNPNGKARIRLPPLAKVEGLRNPKSVLYGLLRAASELRGRRLRRFREQAAAALVTSFVDDFSPLAGLPAFQRLERQLTEALAQLRP